ncbi:MAG: glycosyltransferase family 2 protein [bacterium]|jgi:glycosyltransferase involved in cell wall biosynthesis
MSKEGGYRLKYDNSNASIPMLSIVTVVYNSEQYLERTIRSILNQTFKDVEHIILDGNSKDKTLDIIHQYNDQIAYWKSEPDKGIYDAMNKAQDRATGKYIMFLNSGDEFCDNNVLENIFKINNTSDVYYGDTLITDEEGNALRNRRLRPPQNLTWKDFRYGMLICHQSIIVKRELSKQYNIEYKIAADIDWAIRSTKDAKVITNTRINISKFMEGGMSSQHHKRGLQERFEILSKHYGLIPNILTHIYFAFRIVAQKFLR